jgi:hypothetical protein
MCAYVLASQLLSSVFTGSWVPASCPAPAAFKLLSAVPRHARCLSCVLTVCSLRAELVQDSDEESAVVKKTVVKKAALSFSVRFGRWGCFPVVPPCAVVDNSMQCTVHRALLVTQHWQLWFRGNSWWSSAVTCVVDLHCMSTPVFAQTTKGDKKSLLETLQVQSTRDAMPVKFSGDATSQVQIDGESDRTGNKFTGCEWLCCSYTPLAYTDTDTH